MWDSILNTCKSAGAFLQNGKAPPNTSPVLKRAMEDENHFASKKFFIIFTSALLLFSMYIGSAVFLVWIPKDATAHITAFVSLFSETMKILGMIVASYLGVQSIADFSFNSASNTSMQGIIDSIDKNSTETENINNHIIEEGVGNAPEIRPYSTLATEE